MTLMRSSPRRSPPPMGMSLVEVLIAVCIFVLVIFSLSRLISGSDVHTYRIGHVAKATRLVQQLVEECQNRSVSEYQIIFTATMATGSVNLEPAFFPNTEASLIAFREEHQKSLQFFSRRIAARPVYNQLHQIREIWLEAEVRWTETRPDTGTASPTSRVLRAGGLLCNLEAR